MRRNTYIKVNNKSLPVVFTRKAKDNGALNFMDNILFVLETCGSLLVEDKVMGVRNSAFDYDLLVLLSSDTNEIVLLDFRECHENHKVDIDFDLEAMLAIA